MSAASRNEESIRAAIDGAEEIRDDGAEEKPGQEDPHGHSQADALIAITNEAQLFHAPDGEGFADVEVNGHRETWPIRSSGFRRWLTHRYYEEKGGAPGSEAFRSARNLIEARAQFDAPERAVHMRVGALDGRLYLDLCDEKWRAVEIDSSSWRIVDNPPVRFRRTPGMAALPEPLTGGSVEALRSFLNVRSDDDFVLVCSWLLAALRDGGPYPVLGVSGEQGSAKSTFARMLRALVDPNTAALRAQPRRDHDLFITANNGHVLAFDNVSRLPAWISDTICRLATGGGFAVRQLYTDTDEVLFNATRPIILNGIEDFVTRSDLADRTLFIMLEPIAEEDRRPERELWRDFEAARPSILGALLDSVVHGLARLPHIRLERLPRMADFAVWATACETSVWPAGTFLSAYLNNRSEAVEVVLDADLIVAALHSLMATRRVWTGTASELLNALAHVVDERTANSKAWPRSPRALGGRLRRAAPFLRKVGIEVGHKKVGHSRARIIEIKMSLDEKESGGSEPSAPSASSAGEPETNAANGSEKIDLRTEDADHRGRKPTATVRSQSRNAGIKTAADGADAKKTTTESGPTSRWRARL